MDFKKYLKQRKDQEKTLKQIINSMKQEYTKMEKEMNDFLYSLESEYQSSKDKVKVIEKFGEKFGVKLLDEKWGKYGGYYYFDDCVVISDTVRLRVEIKPINPFLEELKVKWGE